MNKHNVKIVNKLIQYEVLEAIDLAKTRESLLCD